MTRSSKVEPSAHNRLVAGSIPAGSTNYAKVVTLRLKGLTNAQVAERLGLNPKTTKTYWWRYRNKEKAKTYQKKYYQDNKTKILQYCKDHYHNNPELYAEHRYKRKLREAGVMYQYA